jgi:hypothetical protein
MFSDPIVWGPWLTDGIPLAVGRELWLLVVALLVIAGLGILFSARRSRRTRSRLAGRASIVGFRRANERVYVAK